MRRTRITVAAVTATALIGSLSAITLPPANAASNENSSITQTAAFSPSAKTKIDADCRKAIINDLKLRGAIVGALVKAGLSAADAAALAPRIAAEMAAEGTLTLNHHRLKVLVASQLGLVADAAVQHAAAAIDLSFKAILGASIIPNALGSAAFKSAVIANLVAAGIDKHLARATAVAIVATALNPALGPIAKFELIKAEIAAQAALLIQRGVHLQKAAIEHVIGRAFDAAVATAIISSPILSARIVTHLVRAGIDKSIAISLAPHIVKRLAKEPLLAFNTAKLVKDIARQIVDIRNTQEAVAIYKQLKAELPTLDGLVQKACTPDSDTDTDSNPNADADTDAPTPTPAPTP
ncbi:hypothetical protein PAST2_10105, partial [Cutibacterium acnes HL202PA1]